MRPFRRFQYGKIYSLMSAPSAAGQQHQQREDLQPAGQHVQNQHQLGQNAVAGKVAHGADGGKAGADIIKAAQHR